MYVQPPDGNAAAGFASSEIAVSPIALLRALCCQNAVVSRAYREASEINKRRRTVVVARVRLMRGFHPAAWSRARGNRMPPLRLNTGYRRYRCSEPGRRREDIQAAKPDSR